MFALSTRAVYSAEIRLDDDLPPSTYAPENGASRVSLQPTVGP